MDTNVKVVEFYFRWKGVNSVLDTELDKGLKKLKRIKVFNSVFNLAGEAAYWVKNSNSILL